MTLKPARIAALSCCLLLFAVLANAQNPTGALRGEVQDQSGARLAGARIAVQSAGLGLSRQVVADNHGEFRIEGLLPGRYHVVASAKGFGDASTDVDIAVTIVRDITVTLHLAGGRETVQVQGHVFFHHDRNQPTPRAPCAEA